MTRLFARLSLSLALSITAAVGAGPVLAQTPSGVCVKDTITECSTKPVVKPATKKVTAKDTGAPKKVAQKHVKHRGKMIDPITTCALKNKMPCANQAGR